MKIALAQINTTVGDVEGNTFKIVKAINKAKSLKADVVCFHEMTVIGYPPRDLLQISQLVTEAREASLAIAKESRGIAVLFGSIDINSPIGKPLLNVAHWCEDGRIHTTIAKQLLPNYDVFDETRYFEPGPPSQVINWNGVKIGITVCEDIWSTNGNYESDPVDDLVTKGAQVIFNLSASPYSLDRYQQRESLLRRHATRHGVTCVYVNQVGGNDELLFDGGSLIMSPEGQVTHRLPFFKEDLSLFDLNSCNKTAYFDSWSELDLLEKALITGVRDYAHKCGFKQAALGLSGGVDSALVAYLAGKALGAKNVLGVMMPSRYSSDHSLKDSKKLAKNLKISIKQVSIDKIHREYEQEFKKLFKGKKADTTEENVQARIRGNLLMAISNKLGHLILSTGNKSEMSVGYCTLYGDMSGGLSVIGDLPKTLVYKLCQHINRRREIIPKNILTKAPSAELKPNQIDQDSLPPYDILDGILKAYIEDVLSEDAIVNLGFDRITVRRVIKMVKSNEYKRRQAAPVLRVTSKAFGVGRRFPIAAKY